jgi:hypothetical protein
VSRHQDRQGIQLNSALFLVFMGKGLLVSANVKEQALKNLLGEVVFHFTFHYNAKR